MNRSINHRIVWFQIDIVNIRSESDEEEPNGPDTDRTELDEFIDLIRFGKHKIITFYKKEHAIIV